MAKHPRARTDPDASDALAEELETRLFWILGLVNDWLRFAEAKCVGLIGPASGAMALALSGLCLILTLLTGLLSFFPRTDVHGIVGGRRAPRTKRTTCTTSVTSPSILLSTWPTPSGVAMPAPGRR